MLCASSTYSGAGGVAGGGSTSNPSMYSTGGAANNGVPVIQLTTGVSKTVSIQLYKDVLATEATTLLNTDTAKLVMKDFIGSPNIAYEIDCTISDDDPATITIEFEGEDITHPGLWPSAIIIKNASGDIKDEYFVYVQINMGINHRTEAGVEPITVAEIRMALMDYSPDYNTLLNDLEFSDVQVYAAMRRPVDEWNEVPPAVGYFTTQTFPFHEHWLKATCAYLLDAAAYRYNRNSVPHNAGGLAMDPLNKGNIYRQDAMILKQEWKAFIEAKKTELNMNACWGKSVMAGFDGYRYSGLL